MNYLNYLEQPHYLALFCGVISVVLSFAEAKYSKEKHPSKYYLKIFILVVINVYVVVMLIKRGIVPINISKLQSGGGGGLGTTTPGPSATGGILETSSINTSNYQSVDIGKPNF